MSWGKGKASDSYNENGCKVVPQSVPSVSFRKVNGIYPKTWSGLDLGNSVESCHFPFSIRSPSNVLCYPNLRSDAQSSCLFVRQRTQTASSTFYELSIFCKNWFKRVSIAGNSQTVQAWKQWLRTSFPQSVSLLCVSAPFCFLSSWKIFVVFSSIIWFLGGGWGVDFLSG